jgi:hypothetical protein
MTTMHNLFKENFKTEKLEPRGLELFAILLMRL